MDSRIVSLPSGSLVEVQVRQKYNLRSRLTKIAESANGKTNDIGWVSGTT
jgi:hypothetical protein